MASEAVYGLDKSKCKVETFSKDSSFGISTVIVDEEDHSSYNYPAIIPHDGERRAYTGTSFYLTGVSALGNVPSGYYGELIIKLTRRVATPGLRVTGTSRVKTLNFDMDTSEFDIIHYRFTYDGFYICCECCGGYAE